MDYENRYLKKYLLHPYFIKKGKLRLKNRLDDHNYIDIINRLFFNIKGFVSLTFLFTFVSITIRNILEKHQRFLFVRILK